MQQQQQFYMQQYQAQQAAMMGVPVPGVVPMVDPAAAAAYYAPIPLTGDEEDNVGPAAAKSNALPIHGNTTTFNINNLLYNNIMENEYFRALYQLRTYHEVIDEIYRSVDHVEPWQTGTARFPSSAFCLLVKFMLMKLTLKQMNGLLGTSDCPNVRAIGFLYLRYTCPPADLYKWYEPYLEDPEVFAPGADNSVTMTMGEYCTKLLLDMQYFGTTLPRIPVPIERKIKVLLLLLEEKKKRRKANLRDKERGLFAVGAKVRAIYSDDANEPAWYDAVIDSIDEEDPSGHKFWVTFPEYGNSEKVDLGDMELPQSTGGGGSVSNGGGEERGSDRQGRGSVSRSRSRSRDRRDGGRRGSRDSRSRDRGDRGDQGDRGDRGRRDDSRDRGRDRDRDRDRRREDSRDRSQGRGGGGGGGGSSANLLEKVLQSEREASAAVGKNYGQRPASYKGSLSLKQDRYTARRKSPSPESRRRRRSRSRSPPRIGAGAASSDGGRGLSGSVASSGNLQGAGAGVSAEEQAKRMRLLKERYGDASATNK